MVVVKEGNMEERTQSSETGQKILGFISNEITNKTRETARVTQRQKYRLMLSKEYFDLDEL